MDGMDGMDEMDLMDVMDVVDVGSSPTPSWQYHSDACIHMKRQAAGIDS